MTLGLTETWFDTSSKVAFNGLNVVAIKHRRATTAFFNATVAQVFEVLADALEKLIERNPEVKVVVTVSPVPMAQTFTNMDRSEEHTSELQSLMRTSYAVFCLKKQKRNKYVVLRLE